MIFYLYRHGETQFSRANNAPYGDQIETASILPEKIPTVKKLGNYLRGLNLGYYFSSPFVRCIQTSEIIKDITGVGYVTDKRLGEFRDDIGEDFGQLRVRVKDFLDQVEKGNTKGKSVAICTHGGVISAIKHLLINGSYEYEDLMDFPRCGVIWEIKNKKIEVHDFN